MASIKQAIELASKKALAETENILKKDVSRLMEQTYREAIQDLVYKKNESEDYRRTFNLLNSLFTEFSRTKDYMELSTYHNTGLMTTTYPSWDTNDSQDNRDMIALWMARGHGGIVSYGETNFDYEAIKNLKQEGKYLEIIKNGLRAKGYEVK